MPANIFSSYSAGENRVTASIIAVLQSLSIDRIQRLLGELLERPNFELVRFQNQPSKGGDGVPDATIVSSCRLLIETKVARNALDTRQICRHLDRLTKASELTRVLLVITPDDRQPPQIDKLENELLTWTSFSALDQSINELLSDEREVISEREQFLLRELQDMLVREKLIASANDVVVVAARDAWPEYLKFGAYVCQADRPFQLVTRLAFYTKGKIQRYVPKIEEVHEHVEFNSGQHSGKLGSLIDELLRETPRQEGVAYKVMFLSTKDSADTVVLDREIPNDAKTATGRNWAFTLSQTYVSLEKLKSARATSELRS